MTGSSPTQKRIPSGHKMSACRRVRARDVSVEHSPASLHEPWREKNATSFARLTTVLLLAARGTVARRAPVWPQSVWFHGGPVRAKGKVLPGCPSSAPATGARHGQAMRT